MFGVPDSLWWTSVRPTPRWPMLTPTMLTPKVHPEPPVVVSKKVLARREYQRKYYAKHPCAGGCETKVWDEGSTCQGCRRKQAAKRIFGECAQCGGPITTRRNGNYLRSYCSAACRDLGKIKHEDPRSSSWISAKRRRDIHRATWDGVPDEQIFERDKWVCQIPGCADPSPMDPALRGTYGPLAPEIDHIIPLARHGTAQASNRRAAHRRCNGKKHKKLDSELPLVS